MQTVFEDENERDNGRRTDSIDVVLYAGNISRCVKRKYIGEFRIWEFGI